jgi:hypothetical protein
MLQDAEGPDDSMPQRAPLLTALTRGSGALRAGRACYWTAARRGLVPVPVDPNILATDGAGAPDVITARATQPNFGRMHLALPALTQVGRRKVTDPQSGRSMRRPPPRMLRRDFVIPR